MSRIIRFAAPMLLAVIASSGALASADIKTGADLVASCKASLEGDRSPQGEISATACNQFLSGMVVAVYNSTEVGMPTALHRLGPKQDETVCFRLPELLKYQDFAALVVAYDKAHPGLAERPAAELAGHSLADKYPCKD